VAVPTFSVLEELDARLGPKYVTEPRPFAGPVPPAVATHADAPGRFTYLGVLIALGGVLLVLAAATQRSGRSGWLSSRRERQVET
jgi:hypothetical protein